MLSIPVSNLSILAPIDILMIALLFIVPMIVILAALIFYVIVWIRLFDKMYRAPWSGLIPFYRGFVIFRSCRLTPLFFLYLLVYLAIFVLDVSIMLVGFSLPLVIALLVTAIVAFAIILKVSITFASTFDHGTIIGIVLAVFPIIGLAILAFDDSIHLRKTRTLS